MPFAQISSIFAVVIEEDTEATWSLRNSLPWVSLLLPVVLPVSMWPQKTVQSNVLTNSTNKSRWNKKKKCSNNLQKKVRKEKEETKQIIK